ncbi:MAG: YegS/Rv2252/BmrU family lipid kinase [Spirulinaceae cyanobacterium]
MPILIAATADDAHKGELVTLLQDYPAIADRYQFLATQRTGERLQQSCGVTVTTVQPNARGGMVELAARVVAGEIAAAIDLFEPTTDAIANPERQALWRLCALHNVPYAHNLATAAAILQALGGSRTAHLIFNPAAGQGNPMQELEQIRQQLEPQIQIRTLFTQPETDPAEQVREIVEKIGPVAADSTEQLILASGGDGTVSAIASALVNTNIPLGIIPRGTANAFAAALGIPGNIPEACRVIRSGTIRVVDTARCNDQPMILLAGLGFEAGMVDKADRDLKRQFGSLAYILAGVQQFTEQEPFQAHIEIEGQVSEFETAAITVANVAPNTSILAQGFGQVIPDDGLLEVTINTSKTRLEAMNAMVSLFAAALVNSPSNREDVARLRTHRLEITTQPAQRLTIDGELHPADPTIVFECVPESLRVLVPLLKDEF